MLGSTQQSSKPFLNQGTGQQHVSRLKCFKTGAHTQVTAGPKILRQNWPVQSIVQVQSFNCPVSPVPHIDRIQLAAVAMLVGLLAVFVLLQFLPALQHATSFNLATISNWISGQNYSGHQHYERSGALRAERINERINITNGAKFLNNGQNKVWAAGQ